ncbi:DUF3219 family protein [Domibacillus indicus]|uniref:DUF3219 family protein n=1 Tax=Domibacillus indicus TaxID=1437523 RepID=UPI000617DC09|nr:DUF3219 family protein [Domibacillus indicus]
MSETVYLNERLFQALDFQEEAVQKGEKQVPKIAFHFNVTHEEYHDVTTLLYQNDFHVSVPARNIEFKGTIHKYSTSTVNLYEKGAAGDFYLEIVGY